MDTRFRRAALFALALPSLLGIRSAHAGVVNPDISLIGQPVIRWTDDSSSVARKRPQFLLGETELVFDAALNPYAHGTAVFTFADGNADVEEAYFAMTRGLPLGLALKGGKYRVPFGKLNPAHPHTYPFADRFRVLAAYLPGEDGYADTGIELSERIPAPGDLALTASADWLSGDPFRREREPLAGNDPIFTTTAGDRAGEPRPAGLGRLSAFVPMGDRSGVELGADVLQGTNDVAAAARTTLWGADAKLKLWTAATSYLLLQGEFLHLDRDEAGWDSVRAAFTRDPLKRSGGYVFADYAFATRYDAGVSFETFERPSAAAERDQAFGAFAGLALLEESTVFRIGWEHFMPGATGGGHDPKAIDTLTLRVIYSMGPHKAHQF